MLEIRKSRGVMISDSGFGLFLIGAVIVALLAIFSSNTEKEIAATTARQLDSLSSSTQSYLLSDYETVRQAAIADGGVTEIPLTTLRNRKAENDLFPDTSPYKQPYRILAHFVNNNTLGILITTDSQRSNVVPSQVRAHIANSSGKYVGYVTGSHLFGANFNQDIKVFQTAMKFPVLGDVATYRIVRRDALYGDILYRKAIPGYADANRMETDLNMNNHNLEGANAISANSLDVSNEFKVQGDFVASKNFKVEGSSTFGADVQVNGDITSSGNIQATTLNTDSATIKGAVKTGTLASTSITATTTKTTSLKSTTITGETINTDELNTQNSSINKTITSELSTGRITTNDLKSTDAVIGDLITGSCTGC